MSSLRMMATATLGAAMLAATAPAAQATRYAAPAGTGSDPCTFAQPCDLATAIGGATVGDKTVRLFGGGYPAIAATITMPTSGVDIAAEPGTGRPVINVPAGTQLRIISSSRLADVDVVAATGVSEPIFAADGATVVERVRVTGNANGAMLKTGSTGAPSTVRDVLVINAGSGSSSRGIAMECNGCSTTGNVINATVITKDAAAIAAVAAGAAGTKTSTLNVFNTIATSVTAADIVATGATDHAVVNVLHSAYDNAAANPTGVVDDLGGQVVDPPLFTDAAGGDYSSAPGSSVIDAGVDPGTPALSTTDLFGRPRALGTAVDIGAIEAPGAPIATTGTANAVTATTATVAGAVNPGGLAADWRVEYGTTTDYGATVSGTPVTSAGFTPEEVTASLTGLAAATTYHYRVVAEHAFGTGTGADQTLTTAAVPSTTPAGGSTPAPAGGGTPAAQPDRTAPVLSKLALTPKRILRSKLRTPALRFTLSEAATVTVTLERLVTGRRAGNRCVTARKAAAGGRCTKATRVLRITRSLPVGAAKLGIALRRGKAPLPAGAYRVTATAKDGAGNTAPAQHAALTLAAR